MHRLRSTDIEHGDNAAFPREHSELDGPCNGERDKEIYREMRDGDPILNSKLKIPWRAIAGCQLPWKQLFNF